MAKQRRVKVREANRRMVSLPAELNRRMAQTDGVNWSAIAVRAWEQEFGRLAEQKKEKDVTDIVDRLRASKRQSESEFYKDGFECGQQWAKGTAEAVELERIERLEASQGYNWQKWFDPGDQGAHAVYVRLAREIMGSDVSVRSDVDNFWENAIGGDGTDREDVLSQPEFLRGFCEGALDVWNDVKDQL